MTDKQIIIDRVDVSEWTDEEVKYKFVKHSPKVIKTIAFDLYKQLKRKWQECEELKEERNEYFELMAIRTEVLAKIANKLGMNTGIIENNELFCKIDQLKAENEKLDKKVKLLRQYKCSKQASYENMQVERNKAVSRNQDLLKQVEKWQEKCNKLEAENDRLKHDNGYEVGALEKTIDNLKAENEELKQINKPNDETWKTMSITFDNGTVKTEVADMSMAEYSQLKLENTKLKQTLAEIKEIAENMNNECFYSNFDCKYCDMKNGCTYHRKIKILQKISECEAENERKENCN